MGRLSYLAGRILKMDASSIFEAVKKEHARTGDPSAAILADVIYCGLKYGAGASDYKLMQWRGLTAAQRETYVTRGVNNSLVARLNERDYRYIMEDKCVFNTVFSEFIGRDWIDVRTATPESFAEFLRGKDFVFSKPVDATCGKGIEKLSRFDFSSAEEMFRHIRNTGNGLCEEALIQDERMNALYPGSVNTYRIVTLLTDDGPHIVYTVLRCGSGGKFVDNLNSGGLTSPIDLDRGTVKYPACDKQGRVFETHPDTGTVFAGFALPYWEAAEAACLKAAKLAPKLRYVGWDVAVTPKGPVLIEGNHFPGHDVLQLPPHVPDKVGMKTEFRKYISI